MTEKKHGRDAAQKLEARILMAESVWRREHLQILNLSNHPDRDNLALETLAPEVYVQHVCTTSSKYLKTEPLPQVRYSETFDTAFWETVALESDPDLVISDGALSDWHQVAMLKMLFPVVRSGGAVVLQQQTENNATKGNVLIDFLNGLIRSQMNEDKRSIEGYGAEGYLLRNIESVSYSGQCVLIRKRCFPQARLEAVPFSKISTAHRIMDKPRKYERIEARIHGSDKIVARHVRALEEYRDVIAPAAESGQIRDALVSGGGIVHTRDGYIVEESFINSRHVSRRGPFYRIGTSKHYVSERSLEPTRTLSGQFALMKQTWDANYGHWIIDTLPRIKHYLDSYDLSKSGVLVNGSISATLQEMQSASLGLFGIPSNQLTTIDWQTTHIDDLLYVTPSSIPPMLKSPLSIEILGSLSARLDAGIIDRFKSYDRIYLTRNSYPRRRLVNEDELLPFLDTAGYQVIVPESLSFAEQVSVFSRATHVIGNMGAAFSNLAFSPHGVKVFVLATEHMAHDYFYDLVCHKKGEYYALQGTAEPGSGDGIGADFSVEKNAFLRILKEFDSRVGTG